MPAASYSPRESSVGRAFRKKATEAGLYVIKVHGGPFQQKGLPDYLVRPRRKMNKFRAAGDLVVGHPCWVELKRIDGDNPTALQINTAAELAERGDVVIFANNAQWAVDCILFGEYNDHEVEWPREGGVIDLIGIPDEWLHACGVREVYR